MAMFAQTRVKATTPTTRSKIPLFIRLSPFYFLV
jgi:hypothetical protein